MPNATFEIQLEQPLILSLQAASAGAHQCLDHVPGSVLLGLAASRLYPELDAESTWTLFHSGRVRFGDALPVSPRGHTAYPLPLCWHAYKGEPTRTHCQLLADSLFDPSCMAPDTSRQPVQVRSGHTALDGSFVEPQRLQTLKTAIDPQTGMAAESQLFGYEALAPGQRFRLTVSADGDVSDALWSRLIEALPGTARLGRSRSAQFGRVCIQGAESSAGVPPAVAAAGELTLWLLSDLALEHDGQPCLTPDPALLGLPAGSRWLVERSFLRTRRYSPYNAYRRHFDAERQVISRGSVLRFSLPVPLNGASLEALHAGLGLHIECGLGQAWANPPLLADAKPVFEPAITASAKKASASTPAPNQIAEPDTPLIRALRQRQQRRTGDRRNETLARTLFDGLCTRIREARRFLALAAGTAPDSVPGRSQWGRLKQLGSDYRNRPDALWTALTDPNSGVLRARSGWELSYGPETKQRLHHWLVGELSAIRGREPEAAIDRIIGHLAVLGLQPNWQACCEGKEATSSQLEEQAE